MKLPSEQARVVALRALIATPESVIAEQLAIAQRNEVVSDAEDLEGLLSANAESFYALLEQVPGLSRDTLMSVWWDRVRHSFEETPR